MFKYSLLFTIVYWSIIFQPVIKLIINKKDIENNTVVFIFLFIMIPLFSMAAEYCIKEWFIK